MVIEVTTFAGQNWLITPAALAVNEAAPQNLSGQKWILYLSGVTIPNLVGTIANDWRRETLAIRPDLKGPLVHAVTNFPIPVPPGSWDVHFRVQQWVPFAAISSIFHPNGVPSAGFGVDVWRPINFVTVTDAFSGQPLDRIFAGILVDVAVRDSGAVIHRVSYNISLLGQIVFSPV